MTGLLSWSNVLRDIHDKRRSHELRDGSCFNAIQGRVGPMTHAHLLAPAPVKCADVDVNSELNDDGHREHPDGCIDQPACIEIGKVITHDRVG